jgi:hypothetical protein
MSNVVPIPARVPLFGEPAGRSGDWWEPIPVNAAEVATGLAVEANRLCLPVDLLVTLLVEHALVERDIADCGVDEARARAVLVSAREDQPTTGPGRLHTSYARMLRSGERGYERESEAQLAQRDLMLPLRLHDSARSFDLGEVCKFESLVEAIAWEIAAATSGQFMREWALRLLLAEFAAQATRE